MMKTVTSTNPQRGSAVCLTAAVAMISVYAAITYSVYDNVAVDTFAIPGNLRSRSAGTSSKNSTDKEAANVQGNASQGSRRGRGYASPMLSRLNHVSDMSLHIPRQPDYFSGCGYGPVGNAYCSSGGRSYDRAREPSFSSINLTSAVRIPVAAVDRLHAAYRRVADRLQRPGTGQPVKLTVLGGSMTLGGNCMVPLPHKGSDGEMKNKACAWPAQLQEHLTRHYKGRVELRVTAKAATSLAWAINMIPTLVPLDSDIIIVDYIQNDDRPTLEDLTDSGPMDFQASLIAERFLRKLKAYFEPKPLPVIIFLLTYPPPGFNTTKQFRAAWNNEREAARLRQVMWDHYLNYAQVLHHYGMPYLLLQSLTWPQGPAQMPTPGVWKSTYSQPGFPGGQVDKHPDWTVHKICADMIFHALQIFEADALTNSNEKLRSPGAASAVASFDAATTFVDAWPGKNETFWPEDRLGNSGACLNYMSYISAENEGAAPIAISAGWRRYEDRPGKPGWIAEPDATEDADIMFAVRCGDMHVIGIEYLESYEGMGSVHVTFEELKGAVQIFEQAYDTAHLETLDREVLHSQNEVIDGRCTQQNSLRKTREFKFHCARHGMFTSVVKVKFLHTPQSGGKFKIVSVYSC